VGQLFGPLRYKSGGRGFDSRLGHCNSSSSFTPRPHCVSAVDSAGNRNEYGGYLLGGKGGRSLILTIFPNSCASDNGIREPERPVTLRDSLGL
jgi:hypothetical protein